MDAQRPRTAASILTMAAIVRNCQRGKCLRKYSSLLCRVMTRILGEIARFCKGCRWTTLTLGSNSTRQPLRRATRLKRDFLVVEEEVFVHAADLGHQGRVHQHAGAGDPVDAARRGLARRAGISVAIAV